MKITFFLNWMGVVSNHWYEKNNIPYTETTRYNNILGEDLTSKVWNVYYSLGRIDIHGVPDEPFGLEYGVSIMEAESWGKLGDYLSKLKLDYLPKKQELFDMFEKETGYKIKWFKYK